MKAATALILLATTVAAAHEQPRRIARNFQSGHPAWYAKRQAKTEPESLDSFNETIAVTSEAISTATYDSPIEEITGLWYSNNQTQSACLTFNEDEDLIFAVPATWWNDTTGTGNPTLCGRDVQVTSLDTGKNVTAKLLENSGITLYAGLSIGLVEALDLHLDQGMYPIQYSILGLPISNISLVKPEVLDNVTINVNGTQLRGSDARVLLGNSTSWANSSTWENVTIPAVPIRTDLPTSTITEVASVGTPTVRIDTKLSEAAEAASSASAEAEAESSAAAAASRSAEAEAAASSSRAADAAASSSRAAEAAASSREAEAAASSRSANAEASRSAEAEAAASSSRAADAAASSSRAAEAAASSSRAAEAAASSSRAADAAASSSRAAEAAASSSRAAEAAASSSRAAAEASSRSAAAAASSAASNNGGGGGDGSVHKGGYATYFYQNGNPGNCGNWNKDSDYGIALPTRTYANGAHCGKKVRLTRDSDGASVVATVWDSCPTCYNDQSLDLSVAAFKAIADLPEGMVGISWTFV